MDIVIDARGIENNIDGIGRFTLNILKNLKTYNDFHFHVIILNHLKIKLPKSDNISYIRLNAHRFSLFEIISIPKIVNKISPDIYLNTSPYILFGINSKCIFVVHDLMACNFKPFFANSSFFKRIFARQYFRTLMKISLKKATRVITMSKFTANEIVKYYKYNNSQIDIVHEASEFKFEKDITEKDKKKVQKELGLPEKYFLHVGNLKPYKNITNILIAYHRFLQKKESNYNIKFIFTGNKTSRGYKNFIAIKEKFNLNKQTILLENIENSKIPLLYNLSLGLFFPSIMEGFGLPILEAMACKTPVVTSKNIPTEQVAGGHAFLVDSYSIDSLAEGLEHLASIKDLNKIKAAFTYALSFSWEKTTELIIKSFRKVNQ